jgi:hypothetical protein
VVPEHQAHQVREAMDINARPVPLVRDALNPHSNVRRCQIIRGQRILMRHVQ